MFLFEVNEARSHENEIEALIKRYEGKIDEQKIRSVYQEAKDYYRDAPVRNFVSIEVSRDVKEILAEILSQTNTAM